MINFILPPNKDIITNRDKNTVKGIGTKAQEALKLQYENSKEEHKEKAKN